jgi:hypothetical protein
VERFSHKTKLSRPRAEDWKHLARVLAGKITAVNASLILEGVRNKTKRECEAFLSRVTNEGTLLPGQETVQITLTLTLEHLALLDRAREVLSHGGHVPKNSEVVTRALGDLLEHRDPIRKAKRAKARQEKKGQEKHPMGVSPRDELRPKQWPPIWSLQRWNPLRKNTGPLFPWPFATRYGPGTAGAVLGPKSMAAVVRKH